MTSQPPSTFHIGSGRRRFARLGAAEPRPAFARDLPAASSRAYLDTGEPVGSRNISRLLPMSLSPASVRNVMADLEQLGLIYAPHTSAGRLPTEYGLRFFVDALLEIGDLSAEERREIEAQMRAAEPGRDMESLLNEASQALSGLSRGAGVVLVRQDRPPAQACRVRPHRADPGAGGAGRRGRLGREPADRPRPRHHAVGAGRGRQLSQHPAARPHPVGSADRDRAPRGGARAPSSTS